MKDPRIGVVSPNSTEMMLNQQNSEEEPFAEFMWMEHEEEFNRQVRSNQGGAEQLPQLTVSFHIWYFHFLH